MSVTDVAPIVKDFICYKVTDDRQAGVGERDPSGPV
jgi:hypothetical protein